MAKRLVIATIIVTVVFMILMNFTVPLFATLIYSVFIGVPMFAFAIARPSSHIARMRRPSTTINRRMRAIFNSPKIVLIAAETSLVLMLSIILSGTHPIMAFNMTSSFVILISVLTGYYQPILKK